MNRIIQNLFFISVLLGSGSTLRGQEGVQGQDTLSRQSRLNIDSYLRLSNQQLADFSNKNYFIEWSAARFQNRLTGYMDRNSDFMRSCAYRFSETEKNLFFQEAFMRYKLINTQLLIEHGTGMKYRPVFIKIN